MRDNTLKNAIAQVYAAFEQYDTWSMQVECLHCIPSSNLQTLCIKEPRELTHSDLVDYAESILLTVGNTIDFRHFLPRLLELCTIGSTDCRWQIPVVFKKLVKADWQNWPAIEREAVELFLQSFWNSLFENYPSGVNMLDVLSAYAQLYSDLTPLLCNWRMKTSPGAFLQFIDTIAFFGFIMPVTLEASLMRIPPTIIPASSPFIFPLFRNSKS